MRNQKEMITMAVAGLVLVGSLSLTSIATEENGQEDQRAEASAEKLAKELAWLAAEDVFVTTASLHEETASQAPATIRVITRRQIRERGYRSLYELLRDQPGIDFLDHVQAESKGRLTIRGITGNNKFLILQDGIRINSPTGESITPVLENFPLYNVKQVEILYGPASAIYGADAFTGVINMITEEPTEEGSYSVVVEGGQYDTRRTEFYGAQRLSDWAALSFGGHYQATDAPNLAHEYPSDFPFNDLKTFNGSVAVPADERAPYNGSFSSWSTWAKLDLGDNLTLGWNQSLFDSRYSEGEHSDFASYEDSGQTLLMTAYAKYRYEIGTRLSGSIQGSYSRYEQRPESFFNNLFSAYRNAYKYGLGERYQLEPQITIDLEPHTVTAGLTLEHVRSIPHTTDLDFEYDPDKSTDNQDLYYPGTDGTLPVHFYDESYNNIGGFMQAQSRWTDKMTTIAGLRYDHNEDYDDTLNPRAGIVYSQSPRTTWKALYGRAYLAPSAFARFENFGTFEFKRPDGLYQSFFFRVPNPDLEPETLDTYELSVSRILAKDFTTTLVGHYTKADNIILPVATTPDPNFIPGGAIAAADSNQNVGEQESYGFEWWVEKTFRWNRSRLEMWGSFSYVDGHLKDTRNDVEVDLPFASQQMAKAGLTYNYRDRFVVSPVVRWNGNQRGFGSSDDPDINVPDFTVVDVYAELRNRKQNAAIYVRVQNLLDEHYYNGGPRNLGIAVFDQSPQDPRWITVGLRMTL